MTHQPSRPPSDSTFAVAAFLASSLLFVVQPMVAKQLLPLLGGTPAVWTTCMLFFQSCLLAGYAWASLGPDRLGDRVHRLLHTAGLVLALLAFTPIGISSSYVPPAESSPIVSVLLVLSAGIALPMVFLSATSPLLQRWHASSNPDAGDRVWRLYAIGNFASLIVLLAYPLVIEPTLTLTQQRWLWSVGFMVLTGLLRWLSSAVSAVAAVETEPAPRSEATARLWWLVLSAAPSSLLLGVTAYLTTDVAAVPFLWVVPLALYLLAFSLAFAGRQPGLLLRRSLAPVATMLALMLIVVGLALPLIWTIALHLLVVFAASWGMLSELYRRRPDKRALGEFYLWVALGGVLGGIFNSIAAPILFRSTAEYPIALVLAAALALDWSAKPRWSTRNVILPVGVLLLTVLIIALQRTVAMADPTMIMATLSLPLLLAFSARKDPPAFGLAVAAMASLAALAAAGNAGAYYVERSFFGVHKVTEPIDIAQRRLRRFIELQHGTTTHGRQRFDYDTMSPLAPEEPLSYYHRRGPLGQIFERFDDGSPKRVAVIGMGAASIAAYASPHLSTTYFEIDPTVIRLASKSSFFSYISAARERGADIAIVPGDARLTLAAFEGPPFDLLVLDAFSGDSIPIHLLTIEAFRSYRTKLTENAVIAIHVSNRYLELSPVCGRLAKELGMKAVTLFDQEPMDIEVGKNPSIWVALAHDDALLERLVAEKNWTRLSVTDESPLWTDDYSNLLQVLNWR